MTLRYIFHSGFLLETEQSILIFDYWMDPAGVVKSVVNPSGNKHVYVFASHFHEDHFTKEIFEWKQNNPCIDFGAPAKPCVHKILILYLFSTYFILF